MAKPILFALLFAGACASTEGSMTIPRKTTKATEINLSRGKDKAWVKVRTLGDDTIVDFRGREFVFRGLTGYEGTISLKECDLEIGDATVKINEDKVRVKQHKAVARAEHGSLPEGTRVIYAAGSLLLE